jgi:hypothetical protein
LKVFVGSQLKGAGVGGVVGVIVGPGVGSGVGAIVVVIVGSGVGSCVGGIVGIDVGVEPPNSTEREAPKSPPSSITTPANVSLYSPVP